MKNKKEKRVTKALEIIGLKSEVNFHIETIKELKEIVEFYISRIEEEDVYKKTLEENCEFYEKEIKKMENDMKEMSKEYISNYEEVYDEKKELQVENYHLKSEIKLLKENNMILKVIEDIKKKGI